MQTTNTIWLSQCHNDSLELKCSILSHVSYNHGPQRTGTAFWLFFQRLEQLFVAESDCVPCLAIIIQIPPDVGFQFSLKSLQYDVDFKAKIHQKSISAAVPPQTC